MKARARKGFTLVEILIVVVILGILAAIVIPQFSEASTEARTNSLKSSLQTLRSQISLYKVQHNDDAPTAAGIVTQLTTQTDETGAAGTQFGPYLQVFPMNPFTNGNDVGTDSATDDWVYDETDGTINAGLGGNGATPGSDGLSITTY